MNLNYIKEYLNSRKEQITPQDVEVLIKEISDYQEMETSLIDVTKIMRVINDYNVSFLTLVEAYQGMPKNDIRKLPQRAEQAREILCTLSCLHTYLTLSMGKVKDTTYNMKNIRGYMSDLAEKKEHFKSEKMTWATILRSLTQEMSFTQEMRKMDIEDELGYLKYKETK